tara:strand:- start:764 stop:1171 length:408 start_codon:yes stop_codon:yes gene_type:complete
MKWSLQNKDRFPNFNDLVFADHNYAGNMGVQAVMDFGPKDQFHISVVANKNNSDFGFYGNRENDTYEVMMTHYGTVIPLATTSDVLAHQTPHNITKLMHNAWLNDYAWVSLCWQLRVATDPDEVVPSEYKEVAHG